MNRLRFIPLSLIAFSLTAAHAAGVQSECDSPVDGRERIESVEFVLDNTGPPGWIDYTESTKKTSLFMSPKFFFPDKSDDALAAGKKACIKLEAELKKDIPGFIKGSFTCDVKVVQAEQMLARYYRASPMSDLIREKSMPSLDTVITYEGLARWKVRTPANSSEQIDKLQKAVSEACGRIAAPNAPSP